MVLKKNVGYIDSIVRTIVGVLVVITGFYYDSFWGLLGFLPLISGAVSFCPLYKLFNISSIDQNLEHEN